METVQEYFNEPDIREFHANNADRQNTKKKHLFVVCAYGQSDFLKDCLTSLKNQSVISDIIISSSTPSSFLKQTAKEFHVPLHVNAHKPSIGADWNSAIALGRGYEYITLAHQDDLYDPKYAERMLDALDQADDPIIAFCDYAEQRNERRVSSSRLLQIKKAMLFPLRFASMQKLSAIRKGILSFGNPVCCPAVTYPVKQMEGFLFRQDMKSNLDWDAWKRLAQKPGRFVYVPEVLMAHRIHEESTTSKVLSQKGRKQEDLDMFQGSWPAPVARVIGFFYGLSEKSNDL